MIFGCLLWWLGRYTDFPYHGDLCCIPRFDFAMAIMYVLGAGMKNHLRCLGTLTWCMHTCMIRGSILQLKEKEYVEAAKASGASPVLYITRHPILNCIFNNHRTCNIRYSECNYVRSIIKF